MSSLSDLIKRADNVFSLLVRVRAANNNGNCTCVTCEKVQHYSQMHNGHYALRENKSTRFDVVNCHPQCYECNMANKGYAKRHKEYIINRYGLGCFEELQRRARQSYKFSHSELRELIKGWNQEIKQLKKEKGI